MHQILLNNPAPAWLGALAVAVAVTLGLAFLKAVLGHRLARLAARTGTEVDDVALRAVGGTSKLVVLLLGIYAGSMLLVLPPRIDLIVTRVAVAAALVQAALWGDHGLRAWLRIYRANRSDDPASTTSAAAINFIARIALWTIIILMILDNLGVNITTLVASLGIGGIAVALAVQNILGDLFGSLSIVLDKPFEIGDFINVNGVLGSVEYVGLKTTRVRGLDGEQVVFSNSDLLKSRIHNMQRMRTRRAAFTFGVPYGTPEPALRMVTELVKEKILAQQPTVSFDRAHFNGFGPSSLTFEAVYIVNSADYLVHMDVQQEIFLHIYTALGERGIRIALPTTAVQVLEPNAPAGGAPPPSNSAPHGGTGPLRPG
jgi:small-conductance mechanosensitive channel